MYGKLALVLVGATLFSSAQAAITISPTNTKADAVEFSGGTTAVAAGDQQLALLTPSVLLLLGIGLLGVVAVARRESV